MNNYKQPAQADVMPSDVIGYDARAGAWTFNGAEIRREGLLLVDETRTPQQIVADLKGEEQMCPFCPIFESPEVVPQPIGNDFYGEAAKVEGIACCKYCKTVLDMMSPDERAWYVEQIMHGEEVRSESTGE